MRVERGEVGFAALCLALSVPMTLVQLYGPRAAVSDYGTHVELAEKLSHGTLEVPHFVFHALVAGLGKLVTLPIATAIVIALFQVAFGLIVYRAQRAAWRDPRATFAISTALFVAAPISLFTFPNLFLGYFVTNTWHNPTIQVLKPLALGLYLVILKWLLAPREETSPPTVKQWSLLFLLALISTLAKPSFSLLLPPALLIYLIIHFRKLDLKRFITGAFVLGVAIAAVLAWEYFFLYGKDPDAQGIAWAPFEVWSGFEPRPLHAALKLALSLLFPLVTVAADWRRALADRELQFSWLCFLTSFACYALLEEVGPRKYHGNFGWGALIGLMLVFFSSARFVARLPADRRRGPLFALAAHFLCGLIWYAASANLLGTACSDHWGDWCW